MFDEKRIKDEYKIGFIGRWGIGAKTSLISRITNNTFNYESPITEVPSFKSLVFEIENGKRIKLSLWDSPGVEQRRELVKNFCIKDSDCVVIGFDIADKSSFDEVKEYWYPTVKEILKTNLIYLIGNKIDLYENAQVDLKEAKNFAIANNLRYFETSCLTTKGIKEFLDDLKNEIIKV